LLAGEAEFEKLRIDSREVHPDWYEKLDRAQRGDDSPPVNIRYQADADSNDDIVTGVRRRVPEIDFQIAYETLLEGMEDPDVLALAAESGRILVTHDRRTMPTHFGKFIESRRSPGLFIISQHSDLLPINEELILIWAASEAEEYVNSIRTLPL
jgi:hypothetical protein